MERHLDKKGWVLANWRLPKKPTKDDAEQETL
jgi:hypothetical protein